MNRPALSVLIPAFNASRFLAQAVGSVRLQAEDVTGGALEIVIVNDGSTDETGAIADELARQHPTVAVVHQENGGLANARNRGIEASRGQAIWFLDADDEIAPGALAFFGAKLRESQSERGDLVMARGLALEWEKNAAGTWKASPPPRALSMVSTNLQTRAVVERVGPFDPQLCTNEDLDWLLRAQEHGVWMPLFDVVALHYRRHDANMSHDQAAMGRGREQVARKALARRFGPRSNAKGL